MNLATRLKDIPLLYHQNLVVVKRWPGRYRYPPEVQIFFGCRPNRLLSETKMILKRVAHVSGFSCVDRMRLAFLE
jgi:hypothetical protein